MKLRLLPTTAIAVLAAAISTLPEARGIVLDFDPTVAVAGSPDDGEAGVNENDISQVYGDISGQLDVIWSGSGSVLEDQPNDELYGGAGANPNNFYSTGYGNLTNVFFSSQAPNIDDPNSDGYGQITFQPAPGFQLQLVSLSVAGYGVNIPVVFSMYEPSTERLASMEVVASGTGSTVVDFTAFQDYFIGNSGSRVDLYWNVGGMTAESPANVGIDNLSYNVVPEPSAALLLGIGAIGLLGCRFRRS